MHSLAKLLTLLTVFVCLLQLSVSAKRGLCPRVPVIQCPVMTGNPGNICENDGSCPGDQKCCPTACSGKHCTQPVKRGACPDDSGIYNCPMMTAIPPNLCENDFNCPENQKCCFVPCSGKQCTKPAPPSSR